MMRLGRLACLVLLVASGCLKNNALFDPFATESGDGSGGGGGSTDMTQGTGGLECPELDPPALSLAVCELDALTAFNVGDHPVFSGQCDGTAVTVWAQRSADNTAVMICDENCGDCGLPNPIDLNDSRYSFLAVSSILPPAGECTRVVHAGKLGSDSTCHTTQLTLWGEDPTPRFAAGIDTLATLPGTGITLERGETYLCECSDGDKQDTERYPCCANLPVRAAGDVLLTPDDGCQLRVLRGPVNLKRFTTLGSTYDFILHNAYGYEGSCGAARNTIYWTMTRISG